MDNLTEQDISLLFKDLVVVPSDRSDKKIDVAIAEKKAKPTDNQKPKLTEKPKLHPFVCLVPNSIVDDLKEPGSNFSRILASLKIDNVTQYVKPLDALDSATDLNHFSLMLTIGLSENEQAEIDSKRSLPVHHSTNPEVLKTKEEKLAMFGPFKAFISKNKDVFSQL